MELTEERLLQLLMDGLKMPETFTEDAVKEAPVYPLTDMCTNREDTLFIEIALAGFSKDMIEVEIVDDFGIVITGNYVPDDNPEDYTWHQQHISSRNFVRKISLDDVYQTDAVDVQFNDGLLTIAIEKKEPEVAPEPQRKVVPIR